MKRYKLKTIYCILLLLPVLVCCTDDGLLQRNGVAEGIPVTVDINVGTAANTLRTRSALLENEERKIYDLYLWVFNASGDVEFSREYPRSDLYQAASDLEASTGEADGDAPTSMGLLKNISLTTGEKTLFLLANYKSDGDGLFHVEPDILKGIYNPQNEMFATFQTKRYFIQNETSSKKIIFQSIQEAVKKHWKILFLPVLFSLNSVGYVS